MKVFINGKFFLEVHQITHVLIQPFFTSNMAITTLKQFDLSHINVDPKLQGASLASFSPRLLAFTIDWIIIWCITQFLLLIIPLIVLLLVFKGKFNRTIIKSRRIIKKQVLHFGKSLEENSTIEPELKRRFTRGITFYIYVLLYLPVIVSFIYVGIIIFDSIFPQQHTS
ncbi:hypothetical protein BH23BAC1_BH23BAC1_50450 [soil metagenome]